MLTVTYGHILRVETMKLELLGAIEKKLPGGCG